MFIKRSIRKLYNFYFEDVKPGIDILRYEGVRYFTWRLYWYLRGKRYPKDIPVNSSGLLVRSAVKKSVTYPNWIKNYDSLDQKDRLLILTDIELFVSKPLFSIFLRLNQTDFKYLRETLESIKVQIYQKWDIYVFPSYDFSKELLSIVEEYANTDPRIKIFDNQFTKNISAGGNNALSTAKGEWILEVEQGDLLSEHALYLVAEAINRNNNLSIIYSDEDSIDENGKRYEPYFKPDWDYDMFVANNLFGNLAIFRSEYAKKAGGYREGLDGADLFDLALRIYELFPGKDIGHIPFVIYHARKSDTGSLSGAINLESAEKAANEHFIRTGQPASAEKPGGLVSYLKINRSLSAEQPRVSAIIPTKDKFELLKKCTDGLLNRTEYDNLEIVIVDNGSTEYDTLEYLNNIGSFENIKVLVDSDSFNFSRLINNGVAASDGEVCVLLNNDIDVINPLWLYEMVSHVVRQDVGAVGAKLYFGNDTIQHGGVILGINGIASHVHKLAPGNFPGYFNRLFITHQLSCVTGACLAIRREVFDEVGGFNETDLPASFNDVDFCIRIRQKGYKVIWTPNAELYHYESMSRGYDRTPGEIAKLNSYRKFLRRKWGHVLDNDPYYNKNLALDSNSFELAKHSGVYKPWYRQNENKTLNVLIVGRAKTGTTIISRSIYEAINDAKYHLEPKDQTYFEYREWSRNSNVVKIIFEHWDKYPESMIALISNELPCKFDKIVFIVRDPRDELLSRSLYYIYPWLESNGYDEEIVESWVSVIREKENDPSKISFIDLLSTLKNIFGADIIKELKAGIETYVNFLNNNSEKFFIMRYEDFISGKRDPLEDYLGFKLPSKISLGTLRRTLRSGTFGNWKEVFLKEDVELLRSEMGEEISELGYTDWDINIPTKLNPELYSQYIRKLVDEHLSRNS